MKPTKLMAWGNPLLHVNQVVCKPTKDTADPGGPSICSRTKAPHTMLDGTVKVKAQPTKRSDRKTGADNKTQKKFMTSVAEPYLEKVCTHWRALMVINDGLRNEQMTNEEAERQPFNVPGSHFPELGQEEV